MPGYVYILTNPSMAGIIKIGKTVRDPRARARELHTTGTPTPFEVAFELYSSAHDLLERSLHEQLLEYRVTVNREFFRFPLKDAITLALQLNVKLASNQDSYSAISIHSGLQLAFPDWLRTDMADVQIVQTQERVWLEITEEIEMAGYLRDQTIHRTDLGFIVDEPDDAPFFSTQNSVLENARRFVDELGAYSIMAVTNLFHEDGATAARQLKFK